MFGDDNSAFTLNETIEVNQPILLTYIFLNAGDQNVGAGEVITSSVRLKIYYSYTVAAQDGDIIAGGRIWQILRLLSVSQNISL